MGIGLQIGIGMVIILETRRNKNGNYLTEMEGDLSTTCNPGE